MFCVSSCVMGLWYAVHLSLILIKCLLDLSVHFFRSLITIDTSDFVLLLVDFYDR